MNTPQKTSISWGKLHNRTSQLRGYIATTKPIMIDKREYFSLKVPTLALTDAKYRYEKIYMHTNIVNIIINQKEKCRTWMGVGGGGGEEKIKNRDDLKLYSCRLLVPVKTVGENKLLLWFNWISINSSLTDTKAWK